MAVDRIPCLATERFLQPVFDGSGVLRTTRLVEPGEQADLTNFELTALTGKAKASTPQPLDPPGP